MNGLRDRRKRDWFWGEKSAIQALESDAQVAVYVALLILSSEGSLVWASQDTISTLAHCSTRTVARVLPELERLRVVRRADDRTLARLAERLGEIPATVVYELVSVEAHPDIDRREPIEEDNRTVQEQVDDITHAIGTPARRAAVVAVVRKFLATSSRRNIDFGWLIRLYNLARGNERGPEEGERIFVWAAVQTEAAQPRGEPLAYMNKLIMNYEPASNEPKDLSNETGEAFKWQ